jgi:hypothetical protein
MGCTQLPQTLHTYALQPRRNFRNIKILETALGSSPGENVLRTLETNYSGTKKRWKLFVTTKEITEPMAKSPERAPGSSCSEEGFCSSETRNNVRAAPRRKLHVSVRTSQKRRQQNKTKCPWFDYRKEWFSSSLNRNCVRWLLEDQRRKGDKRAAATRKLLLLGRGFPPILRNGIRLQVKHLR